jgi:hypothetical protein
MFSREEASRIRHEFWTTFGKYMSPVLSAEGMRVNWVNYHTGIKDVFFRMETKPKSAEIYISVEHNDVAMQELFFEQFRELKKMLDHFLEEEWNWQLHASVNGRVVSKIYQELQGVSVFNRDQWPELISFFKPRMIKLDAFWENGKYAFEDLK